jgi:ABC-2 type transport system permease protein
MLAVAARELRWIRRDPVARFLLLGVPVIAFAVLGFTFSHAVVRGLDVVVVDMDNSATSRLFIQTVAAAPGITVAERANDLRAAASAVRAGRAIGAVYLPPDFGKDLLSGRAPRPVAFVNTQYFTPGNNASKSIRDAMTAASAAVAPARQAVGDRTEPGPGLVPEEYVLSNPALNYAQFLLRAVLPTVLHVVIAISAGYAVGSEFRRRSMRAWWDLSGHSVAAALLGKMLPYYIVLMLMFVLMVGILDLWLGVSFRGDAALTAVSASLLIVAYQMIGALMQLLTRNMPVGLSLTAIIVSPAFGYAGVGFPVLAMQAFPRAWGSLLPLRWYIQILFDQASRGAAVRYTAMPFAILLAITIVLALLVWLRFRALVRRGLTNQAEDEPLPPAAAHGVSGAFAAEWRRALSDRGVFGLFVLAPVLYAVFYPQPYLGQIVRNIPIAVVDQDHSELGRGLIQALDAHGNISVALRASSYREAEDAIFARRAFAILAIPPETEKNVLKGVAARLPI